MNIAARRHSKPPKLTVPQRAIRMSAIVWMLEGDQQLYQSLNSTALSLMRLEGLREEAKRMTDGADDDAKADEWDDVREFVAEIAHLLDPLPFEDDDEPGDTLPISTPNPRGEESVPSQLEQAIAEAMAEA